MIVRTIDTDNGTLAVTLTGAGPLVICAPGIGDTRDSYAVLTTHLVSAGYRVAAVDVRGHGDSTATFTSYGDAAMAADFLTLITKLNGNRPAVLVGCSFSAGAAVMAAGRRPDLVAGLVLLGPFVRPGAGPVVTSLMQSLFWRPWGPAMWEMYAKTLWPGLGKEGSAEKAKKSRESLTRDGRWKAFQQTVAGADHRLVVPWHEKVQAPMLVVMGDQDPDWSDPVKEAEWIHGRFTGSELLVVPGVGHAPHLEKPDVVSPSVLKLLGKVRAEGKLAGQ